MKKINSRYFTIAIYSLLVVAFLFVFGYFCFNFGDVFGGIRAAFQKLSAIVYGVVLALILLPVLRFMKRLFGKIFRRGKFKERLINLFSLIASYLLIGLLIVATLLAIVPAVAGATTTLPVPADPSIYTVSGNNYSGFIVTITRN